MPAVSYDLKPRPSNAHSFLSHTTVDAVHPKVDLSPRLMDQAYLPKSVLYATSARIGGIGLDAVAMESLRGLQDQLGLAIAYGFCTYSNGGHSPRPEPW